MVLIVERVLRATEHDERVETGMRFRQAVAGVRPQRSPLGAGLGKRLAHEAQRRLWIILNDKDAHHPTSAARLARPAQRVTGTAPLM